MTVAEAKEVVERAWFFPYRGLTLDEVRITSTPGYWEKLEPCGGAGECPSPLHWCFGCKGPVRHTVSFAEWGVRDKRGRFVSPHRAWKALRSTQPKEEEVQGG